jgi:hypothetical protein
MHARIRPERTPRAMDDGINISMSSTAHHVSRPHG